MKKLIVGMLSAFMALSTAMTPVSASNDVEKKVTSPNVNYDIRTKGWTNVAT